jgi:hypothetical protein
MVTAEFAVALPAFVLVVLAGLCGIGVMTTQLRCADAAGVAARMAARGESATLVRDVASTDLPGTGGIGLVRTATTVTATVHERLSLPGLSFLPGVQIREHAVEALEPAPLVEGGST